MYITQTLYANIVPSLFVVLSRCPQTDAAQFYNTVWPLYAHTSLGSNRPFVFNRLFSKQVIMTSYMVANTSLDIIHITPFWTNSSSITPFWTNSSPISIFKLLFQVFQIFSSIRIFDSIFQIFISGALRHVHFSTNSSNSILLRSPASSPRCRSNTSPM